jgi:uncharacterized secreted protein with C-terminal beta-propeller domain
MRSFLFGALGLSAIALLSSSTNAQPSQPVATTTASPLAMTASKQCDAVRDLVIDTVVHQMVSGYGYGYNGYPYPARPAMAPEAAPAMESKAASAPVAAQSAGRAAPTSSAPPPPTAGPSHYTKTNVQERGVDEGDIVKTDGKFIYTLRNNELVIAKTWPVDKPEIVARLTFKTMVPGQLYLQGERIVLQGYATQPRANGYPYGSTRLLIVDVKDRERPRLSKIYDVDGGTFSSRIVGDDLYLVQNGSLQAPPKLYETAQKVMAKIPRADHTSLRPWEIQGRLAATLRRAIYSNLTKADIDSMLPAIHHAGGKTPLPCDELYMPTGNMQLGLTAMARISLTTGATDMVGALVSGGTVYASTDSLYVAAPHYNWNNQGYANYQTQVHQFSLADKGGKPRYVASGVVEGQLLNQFSMSEHNGDLRIATTEFDWSGRDQGGNHLFVMRPRGNKLEVIGAVRGLAKGERIYAGRMFGDKGYLVTFRQTDPLYTLDLSNPTRPRVAGELKINGFSNYIHPMGGNLLLTIGQDADNNGRVKGMHLQVFDVSNPANPTRRFHETFTAKGTYSSSIAQYDHHAFTYDAITGTLALPLQEYSNDGTYYQGLVAFRVDPKKGFKSLGRIDHRSLADKMIEYMCIDAKRQKNGNEQYYCQKQNWPGMRQSFTIDRSIVVDKYLMTLGTAGLMVHKLASMDQVSALSWSRLQERKAIAQ